MLDQSRIGAILTGDREALHGGPPVDRADHPEHQSGLGRARPEQGEARLCARRSVRLRARAVHDRDGARWPTSCCRRPRSSSTTTSIAAAATNTLILGPKLVEPPGECRNNHEVICALAKRVGAEHPGFAMSPRELIDQMLRVSKRGTLAELEAQPLDRLPAAVSSRRIISTALPGRTASSASSRTGRTCRSAAPISAGRSPTCRRCRTTGPSIEQADDEHPFRLATSPARGFLNSTFNETPTSLAQREAADGDDPSRRRRGARHRATAIYVVLGNRRGEVRLHAQACSTACGAAC